MENVDTDRMRRVLSRVQAGPETGGPNRPQPWELLAWEEGARAQIRALAGMSGACDRALAGAFRRCGARLQRLRAEAFLTDGRFPARGRTSRQPTGVLSGLRTLYRQLEWLGDAYGGSGAEDLAGECRADAAAVRALLEQAMR